MADLKDNPRVVVVGSANMDLVVRAERMPAPGETLLGGAFASHPGGKGANQAVAAARLGADCHFVGRIGADEFGARLRLQMEAAGVGTECLVVTEGESSGVALIVVDGLGENAIVVASGANARVCREDVDEAETLIASADAVLVQLELPMDTVLHAIQTAKRHGVRVVLDPAPAPQQLPPGAYEVDIINPNQCEASQLTGEPIGDDFHSAKLVATELIRRGVKTAVIKLGRRGVVAVDGPSGEVAECRAFDVKVVDTTAAGDAFAAGLTVATASGRPLTEAIRFACAAGSLACSRMGAQPAMPSLLEVQTLMEAQD